MTLWKTARRTLDLTERAVVLGILNVTPDSFSDGGLYLDPAAAVDRALAMLDEGAAILDVGGESTRPGAAPVSAPEEMARVFPVIEALTARAPDCLISIDTSKAAVARGALERGAAIVNDVTALRGDPAMAEVVRAAGAGVVLMHMQGDPRTMQLTPAYRDVCAEVRAHLLAAVEAAEAAGIARECIALDPGIGFGKTVEHNLGLLRGLDSLGLPGRPLVLGVSRKAFLGKISGSDDRLPATLAITAYARQKGVRAVRVHDVRANAAALRTVEALLAP